MPRPDYLPLVAVTATTLLVKGRPRLQLDRSYTDALQRAGLVPVVVPPGDPASAESLLTRVDGLVLSGGEDVDPALYGAERHPETQLAHAGRDRWERALALAARDRRLPTLAICRGIQVANVALGGTLLQDIATGHPGAATHTREEVRTSRVHEVRVEPGSQLAAALGATHLTTNSLHHQAVQDPGNGLRIVARAADGVVEGIEWAGDDWWMVGVQWHPEEIDQTAEPWDRNLFAAFRTAISASSASASRRAPGA